MFNTIENLIGNDEKSIVNIDKLVKWKKSKKLYNFTKLPETAILTMFPAKKKFFPFFSKKKIRGIKGRNFLINNKIVLCTECGYGAPYIINLCEELKTLGVSNFIFIGLAGTITRSHQEGELLYVEKTFSGVGASYYYDKKEEIMPNQSNWSKGVKKEVGAKSVTCWSTDAPFRETLSLKNYYVEKGAEIVEMECAAIYAFANYYRLNASCFTIISDQLTDEWYPPKDYNSLVTKGRDTIARIVNLL